MGRNNPGPRPSEKALFLRAADALLQETVGLVCREKVFPKRSRWLFSEYIIDLIQKYHSCVMSANDIVVKTRAEFLDRHRLQALGMGYLKAANDKVSAAQSALSINADYLAHWGDLWDNAVKFTQGWITKDAARLAEKFGPLDEQGITQPKG